MARNYTLDDLIEQMHISNDIIRDFDNQRERVRNVIMAALESTQLTKEQSHVVLREIADILRISLEKE